MTLVLAILKKIPDCEAEDFQVVRADTAKAVSDVDLRMTFETGDRQKLENAKRVPSHTMICSVVPFQVTFRRVNGFVDRSSFLGA